MLELTTTNIAKFALRQVVALNVAKAATTALETYTEIDTDTITVTVGTGVVGQLVALKTKPYTDAIVDKAVAVKMRRKMRKTKNVEEVEIVDAEVVEPA